ncbi:autotransporter domain-containing protein [Sphingomonas sp.]|jgi:hypothetical protein|uniref:autotransporter domain-containing protein n=1 Tax=Sphingomonas sp. TaxID=28214 RepID=UPI002E32EEF2|nr:autotransporter domain-containing protein [Sphingomonas sp.]HEX4693177.1 autotransporter domain-containing protein [Sphingomonas sp.]
MSFSTARPSARLRTVLFTSAAIASMAIAGTARAQSVATPNQPDGSYLQAQGNVPEGSILEPQSTPPEASTLEPQVVISQPGTPTTARDANDVTGIGEMIIDQKNGFIGLCTGTLINPRTVIFASHCVNENPSDTAFMNPWGYGTGPGQLPIAFGFRANNNAAGNSAFGQWLGNYKTNVANYIYNVNQVSYNPASTTLGLGNNFLQGDIAIATLDTPAANVPTWAILLSQLPVPGTTAGVPGTGYHVTIAGYGDSGTGNTGDTAGVDFRRRIAENYIGILGSLDDQDTFLFGGPDGLAQNLYQLDFDDPRRGTLNASIYDFNVFKDIALPSEGITAPGDSGGPLILDNTYNRKLVIAVLSGGDRFYGAQRSASYGTTSFYQPLYLFWDWIAANNNYHYVGTKAGDANWNDATHWVSNIDPNYMTIVGGNLVNGVPTTLGDGVNGTSGKFGEVCFDTASSSDCYNLSTGVETYTVGGVTQTFQYAPAGGAPGTSPLPTATLDNGLPGATNFVPNDRDPNATTQTRAAYFDVTLGAAGTTTLDTSVTIDRLTVAGSASKLNVTSTGSLRSLIDITQLGGLVTANGTITSVGDYLLFAGGIQGSGRINAPFLTSVTGMIAPGTVGTTGTLTVGGNLILSSGNVYMVDLAGNNVSDKIAVVANGTSTGMANIGGTVLFSPTAGSTVRFGDNYTILTAAGGVTGTFATPAAISAILRPTFTYSANAVNVQVVAGTYASVVANTPVQTAYAQLLDQNRALNYNGLSSVYGVLDLATVGSIQSTLESWAPRSEQLGYQLDRVAVDNMSRFYNERTGMLGSGQNGGTVAMIGQPLAVLAGATTPGMATDALAAGQDGTTTAVAPAKLPSNMSAYIAGGYLRGNATPMPTAIPIGGRNDFDGYYFAGGLEADLGGGSGIGVSGAYTHLDGTTMSGGAKTGLVQFTVYGKKALGGKAVIDGQFGIGSLNAKTVRTASLGGTNYTLRSSSQPFVINGELGISAGFDLGSVRLAPRAAIRGASIGLDDTQEYGGPMALRIHRRSLRSLEGRLGATLDGGQKIHPYLSGYYVHDFQDGRASFGANFAGGVGPNALFALSSKDKDWFEVSGGLAIDTGPVTLSVGADTTIARNDVDNQSYRGSIKFRF